MVECNHFRKALCNRFKTTFKYEEYFAFLRLHLTLQENDHFLFSKFSRILYDQLSRML